MLSERTSSESTGEEMSPAALRAHLSSGGSSSAGGQQAVGMGEGGRGRSGTPTAASAEREGATTAAPGLRASSSSEMWGPSELYGELRDVSPSLSPGVVSDSSGPEVGEGPHAEVEEEEMEDRGAHKGFSDDESSENSDDAAASEFAGGVGRALSRSLSNRGAAATAGAAEAGSSSRSDLGTRVERIGSATRSSAAAVAFQSTPAGVAASGAAAEVGPPTSVTDVQDVGSTAAAIAMVERSMERERQGEETARTATGPASPQQGRRRRNSGNGLSVLRNTWQGGATGGRGGGGVVRLVAFLFVFYFSGGERLCAPPSRDVDAGGERSVCECFRCCYFLVLCCMGMFVRCACRSRGGGCRGGGIPRLYYMYCRHTGSYILTYAALLHVCFFPLAPNLFLYALCTTSVKKNVLSLLYQ